MVLSEKKRLQNIEATLRRGLPDMASFPAHSGVWNVVAGGPSLRKEILKIRKAKGEKVSVNGTHDYLLAKGIKPSFFILTDPQKHCERFVRKPQKGITYLIAAHCDPSVFDNLEGFDVRVWYPLDYELPVPVQIGGGTTVGLRSINIGYTLGFRDIHLWGFDGCVKESHHAYPQKENDSDETKIVTYDGRRFEMTEWMCAQAHNFEDLIRQPRDFSVTVHSRGVIKYIGEIHGKERHLRHVL